MAACCELSDRCVAAVHSDGASQLDLAPWPAAALAHLAAQHKALQAASRARCCSSSSSVKRAAAAGHLRLRPLARQHREAVVGGAM